MRGDSFYKHDNINIAFQKFETKNTMKNSIERHHWNLQALPQTPRTHFIFYIKYNYLVKQTCSCLAIATSIMLQYNNRR
jgi:hypothetical protein